MTAISIGKQKSPLRSNVRLRLLTLISFVKEFGLAELSEIVGAVMKDKHTVIEKWPFRLKLAPGQSGAQEEFELALRGGPSTKERYVEWKRVYAAPLL